MKFIRILASIALSITVLPVHAEGPNDFFDYWNFIGCGTIKSVSRVDQKPIYDYEYALRMGIAGSVDASGTAGQLVSGGVIGLLKGVVANVAVSEATKDGMGKKASDELKGGVIERPTWKREAILAVKIQMDDGNVMHLPVQAPPSFFASARQYVPGKRARVFWLVRPTFESIQLQPVDPPPAPGTDGYEGACKPTTVRQEKIDELEKYGANLVDESKIFE